MRTDQRPGPVVVAVDGTHRSAGAVRYAIGEARRRGSWVRLVHVAPAMVPDDGQTPCAPFPLMPYLPHPEVGVAAEGQATLRQSVAEAQELAPDVAVDGVLRRGRRVRELASAAEACDLMVVGRETRHGAERLLAGATTAGVAARAPVPVAVVPARWQRSDRGRVVVGIGSGADAGELLGYAFRMAEARDAALIVVHAQQGRGPHLEPAVADWSDRFPGVELTVTVAHGRPAQVVLDAAADADVVVVGRHRRDLEHVARLGPTAREVIAQSDIPVEVVPVARVRASAPLGFERSGLERSDLERSGAIRKS